MTAAQSHEIAKRERRIAELEREVERLGNIISVQADAIVSLRLTLLNRRALR